MLRTCILTLTLITIMIVSISCGTGDPVTPPGENPGMQIALSRANPDHPEINLVIITVNRTEDGGIALPGRNIEITSSSGDIGLVTDRGDGTYEAIWTGTPEGEVSIIATDPDTDPPVQAGITFIALEHLLPEWDVPIKLKNPVSTDGWEAAPFIYPDGDKLVFAYITLDMVALAADVTRLIGEERPGQSTPQTFDLYIAERPDGELWWTGWTVEHAEMNYFQALPMHIAAPSVTSDGLACFVTVQEFVQDAFEPTTIWICDPDFMMAPSPVGPPVNMTGLGEDNPYYDATNGWLYFDTYDLGDPLSKQNIWAAQTLGNWQFSDPVPLVDLNTVNIETQPFMHEPTGMLYFATDRGQDEFILAIWRSSTSGTFTLTPEKVAGGNIALGCPSISYDGEWFCFMYARMDASGANADIAMARRIE